MKYYVVDAFAEKVFEGNPAGVCIMEEWLPVGEYPIPRLAATDYCANLISSELFMLKIVLSSP